MNVTSNDHLITASQGLAMIILIFIQTFLLLLPQYRGLVKHIRGCYNYLSFLALFITWRVMTVGVYFHSINLRIQFDGQYKHRLLLIIRAKRKWWWKRCLTWISLQLLDWKLDVCPSSGSATIDHFFASRHNWFHLRWWEAFYQLFSPLLDEFSPEKATEMD